MQVPLEISFRGVRKTKAIENLIREKVAKLENICNYMISCHVAVEIPQQHQKTGNPFRVRIDIRVPAGHELVVKCESSEGDMHDTLPKVLRKAFNVSNRKLKELLELQRGKIKTHAEQKQTVALVC